ncbi:MAG: ABC transporter substrate-binding protein, partial [Alphaproteobacteria bacterium]|nr:ABC transporter substrate-binding protein [Alphaproteobacteria bacterium]
MTTTRTTIAALAAVTLLAATPPAGAQTRFECARKGGDLVFGLEAKVPTYDQHVSTAGAARNIAAHMYEALMTRDEKMIPMLSLAESLTESPDGKTFTFKLRKDVQFHNGKTMTSADVLASYERYKRVGVERGSFAIIDRWEAPDAETFIVHLKERQATFLDGFSNFTAPVVIIPAENAAAEANRLPPVGTGPYQLVDFGDTTIKLRRFDGFKPDTRHTQPTGFGGYKQACADTITFRILIEGGTRTAALETGEVHIVEDVPTTAQKRLAQNTAVKLVRLEDFWLHVSYPNFSFPPTDNLKVRQAIQAALDMEEIMEAASDGAYKLGHAFQFRGSPFYSEAGKALYNQKNKDKARRLLQEGGYKGEKVILLTNRDYVQMYNASVVMNEQLKAAGINSELLVLDWPAALDKSVKDTTGWNFFFSGWTSVVAQGGLQSLRFLANPFNVHKPKDNQSDPEFMAAWSGGLSAP